MGFLVLLRDFVPSWFKCAWNKRIFYLYGYSMQRFGRSGALLFFSFDPKPSSMSGIQYVTKETLEQMKADLQRMKSVDRPAASRAIAEAREKGDLKENAEYDAAKEAQGILEAKIAAMEGSLVNVRVLDEANIDTTGNSHRPCANTHI